jgi:hypothetical protein
MRYFILFTLVLALALPASATEKTSAVTYGWSIYTNDDMKGTTSVTIGFDARQIVIRNAGTTGTISYVLPDAVASTAAAMTVPPGAALTVDADEQTMISTVQFFTSATCSVELLARRGR